MAFNLASRFPPLREMDECIFGPGAYQNQMCQLITKNKAPFNTKASRDAGTWKPYTDQLYSPILKHHIPNCTAFDSKKPRFPYEALSKDDIEKLICRCSMECECPLEGDVVQLKKKEVCQKDFPRKLIVGRPPRSVVGMGKPEFSETEMQKLKHGESDPPFYDTKVFETTSFYHGCKWSQRTAKRFQKNIDEERPAPDTYTIDPEPREDVLCAEKIRFFCRKASKQPRLAEILQDHEMRHGGPGPAAYYPVQVNRNAVSVFGPRAHRFKTQKYDISPGPADYSLKGQFDLAEPPTQFSFARLPPPSFFGTRATRFKAQDKQVGPGPSDYLPEGNLCRIQHCVEGAPFGTSAPRFKNPNDDQEYIDEEYDEINEEQPEPEKKECKQLSWMFRSTSSRSAKTPRPVEPRLVEYPHESKYKKLFIKKKVCNQRMAPFKSSDARFLPWNDWVSVYGRLATPGPGTYSIEKPKCYHPAVCRGPLFRAPKTSFFAIKDGPAPNERNISRGLNIKTFNLRLQNNELNRKSFKWVPPKDPRKLTLEEKESLLLKQSIALLDDTSLLENKMTQSKTSQVQIKPKTSKTITNE